MVMPKLKRPKLLRSNPLRYTLIHLKGKDPAKVAFDDDSIIVNGIRTVRLVDEISEDSRLSYYVKLRLFMARQLALRVWQEKWG